MKKLIILQTTSPDYRKSFYAFLKQNLRDNFVLYRGEHYFENSVLTDKSISFGKNIRNHFLLKRKFLFQTGSFWREVFRNNILVLEMNPRIISNWMILILRKILFKKTVLWGHAWPRSGSHSKSDKLRNIMRSLGDEIIVYTNSQKKELKLKMPQKEISSASNALYYKNQMVSNNVSDKINNIIYVGRLTPNKKPLFLVKAFNKSIKKLPKTAQLIIVGDGEEKQKIIDYTKANNLRERVKILGHVSDYEELKKLYHSSLVSVSPGYVGLSVTQSLGFGVPMVVSKHEKHSPEIEAIKINFNALYYKTNKLDSLSQSIEGVFEKKDFWVNQRLEISEFCRNNYSIEVMADPFLNLTK